MILSTVHQKLERLATKTGITILFVLAHSVLLIMMTYTFPKINAQLGAEAFDLRPAGYSPSEAMALLQNLDLASTNFYLFPQLFLLDVLYPILLAFLLSTLIIRLSRLCKVNPNSFFSNLYVLPFLAMLADYAENIMIAIMISEPANVTSGFVQTASIFTQLKAGITTLSWVSIIVLFVLWLVNRKSNK
ncbi:hypothetical protein [Fulvivirga lutimaris]|uniref:hypothetical protein n=1 Tax=Fulvivirga lutimaris TaxID=1819566 RepID=UPI0012BD2AD8|nr:hypothetical protein [Fulvivirga lutimaris]MTI38834.1 hypothetical protein [Fulvivirga lutimaris]